MFYNRIGITRAIVGVALVAFFLSVSTSAMALERRLAGITLGTRVASVLKKYGNPLRIVIGANANPSAGSVSAAPAVQPYAPMGENSAQPSRDLSPFAGLGAGLGPGALPGLSSVGGMPGMNPSPMGPMPINPNGAPGASQQSDEVRWVYDIPKNGPTVEFIVDDGLVSQITVSGGKSWQGAKTAKGVGIGDNYKKVLLAYGYPDKQEYAGRYLRVGYLKRSNIMFTLRDSKSVVGITIGLKTD